MGMLVGVVAGAFASSAITTGLAGETIGGIAVSAVAGRVIGAIGGAILSSLVGCATPGDNGAHLDVMEVSE